MNYPLHRFRAFAELTGDDERVLRTLGDPPASHPRHAVIAREGDAVSGVHLVIDGWIASSMVLRSGKRLIQKMHLPGDIMGSPGMVLARSPVTLTAITETVTSFVPTRRMGEALARHPRFAAMFLMAVQMERLALMDALAVTGNASSRERLARLLLDFHARLLPLGLVQDDAFELPLTQELIGDLLGLTVVHTNRTIRALEGEGLIERIGHRLRLLDIRALQGLSPVPARTPLHDPSWMPPPP